MPQIHHLPLEEAQTALQAAGLPFRVQMMQSMTVSDGELIAVLPRPGTNLESGTEVVLTVSSGPPRVSD